LKEHLEKAGVITSEYNSHSVDTVWEQKFTLEVGENPC